MKHNRMVRYDLTRAEAREELADALLLAQFEAQARKLLNVGRISRLKKAAARGSPGKRRKAIEMGAASVMRLSKWAAANDKIFTSNIRGLERQAAPKGRSRRRA